MGHQNHRSFLIGTEAAQQLEGLHSIPSSSKVLRRLVRQQYIVAGEERATEHQSALLPSG